MKKVILALATLSLMLSACGAVTPAEEAPPALTGDDIQATAISMAWTMAAETIAAIPTNTFTPVPPTATFTPAFTPTPPFTPTPLFTVTPLATAIPEKDRCDQLLSNWVGTASRILFVNETKNDVTISIYLSPDNSENQCGYFYVPPLAKKQSTSISVPYGTFYVYAWASGNTNFSLSANGYRINNPDKHEVHIRDNMIKWIGP